MAAYNAKLWDKAIQYYSESAKYKYGGAKTYSIIANTYYQKNDSLKALNVLEEGLKVYVGNADLLAEVISYYLTNNKADEAMKYLKIALEKEPKNPTYNFVQGTLYEKLKNIDEAIKCYEKAIEYKFTMAELYKNGLKRRLFDSHKLPQYCLTKKQSPFCHQSLLYYVGPHNA